jgi:DNA primase
LRLYPKEFIEELKTRLNIVDVVSRYVPGVTKKGKNHVARCPFHNEKTPSFSINEYEQFYHCFGCGKSGDVIRFIEEIENVDYAEAVALLAKQANMSLPDLTDDAGKLAAQKKKKDKLYEILKKTARFYYDRLKETDERSAVREYLEKRRIDGALITRLGLGYSPDFTSLPEYLKGACYGEDDIIDSGAAVKARNDGVIDAMAGRLVFPIINVYDDVIGFSGRIIGGKDGVAKYKNTGATLVFDKSRSLYGVNLLRKEKRKNGVNDVILVEGHIDLAALSGAGIANAVASMGTALTKYQAALIKRYSEKVFIAYDGDKAGESAALRGLEILAGEGLDVRVITLPEGLDPDDVLKKYGAEYFLSLKNGAAPLYEYKIHALKKNCDLTTNAGRGEFAMKALGVLKPLGSGVLIEPYLGLISEISGINYDAVRREFQKTADISVPSAQNNKAAEGASAGKKNEGAYMTAARFVLHSMLMKRTEPDPSFDLAPYLTDGTHKAVYGYVKSCFERGTEPRVSGLFDELDGDGESGELNAVINFNAAFSDKSDEKKYYADSLSVLKKEKINAEIRELKETFGAETDTVKRRETAARIDRLLKEAKGIKGN